MKQTVPGSAVILAAGASSRMGSPKALLPWRGDTFLGSLCSKLNRFQWNSRLVVTRAELLPLLEPVLAEGWQLVVNPAPDRGMLSSLQTALRQLPQGTPWALVTLVDQPGIRAETFAAMIQVAGREGWASAAYQGRNGHPMVVRQDCFQELLEAPPEGNPRDILRRFSRGSYECEDPQVLVDFDTPEQLRSSCNSQVGE